MTRHLAFTAIELMVGVLVMAVLLAVALISPDSAEQTAKHEAERVQAYLYRVIQKADRLGLGFTLDTLPNTNGEGYCIQIQWPGSMNYERTFKSWDGCSYSDNFKGTSNGELVYNAMHKRFLTGGTITITAGKGTKYYVIIASTEGRIRISDTAP
ncbi:MAG: type II secretion system protein [Synergistaceae bacterium]|nr:type II secretion system protein [Synergistaceae bacterium]MBR0035093.1 type II secretion system protein [Synergistaceae bacterium]